MNIGQIIVLAGFEGEVVFNDKFLKMNRVEQIDLLQDIIADLSAMHQHMMERDATAQDFLNECEETDSPNFKIQVQLYNEE